MMNKKYINFIFVYFLLFNLAAQLLFPARCYGKEDMEITIVLDPGHGGEEDGACYYGYKEKDINLTLAYMVKKELEEYRNVKVVLTRTEDETVSLVKRAEIAKQCGGDILISMHFNASTSHGMQGASVYISTSDKYRENQQQLADCLMGEFEAIGLQNSGVFARVTQRNKRRGDGSFEDYYGIIRNAYNYNIPGIIIEHGYLDSKEDIKYVRKTEGLEQIARADANGIAAYYRLQKEDGTTPQPKHAEKFMATTKGIAYDYYEAPEITGVSVKKEMFEAPEIVSYEITVEDGLGISYIYFVYENCKTKDIVTVPLLINEPLTSGTYEVDVMIPYGVCPGNYRLCYMGAYNLAGYDAGYNYDTESMVGFGKCHWLNTFPYHGEADLTIDNLHTIEKNNMEASICYMSERICKEKLYKTCSSK